MKLGFAIKFNTYEYKKLNDLIYKNRMYYGALEQEKNFIEYEAISPVKDTSWRHPEVILKALEDKNFKVDFIIGTGQNSLVTNMNITICEQINKYLKEDQEMILQSMYINPKYLPMYLESNYLKGNLLPKAMLKPELSVFGE